MPDARVVLGALVVALFAGACKCAPSPLKGDREKECRTDSWNRRQQCKDTLKFIRGGTWPATFSEDFIHQAVSVNASLTATVERGPVRIWFKTYEGQVKEVTVKPGQPAQLAGRPVVDDDGGKRVFVLYYQPLEGTPVSAEGLVVDLEWDLRDH